MTSKRELLRQQRRWARSAGLSPDARGYLETVENNLWQPLSASARAGFEQGSGSEIKDTPARPAKMKALHSSAVLAANLFDHWMQRDAAALMRALDIGSALRSLRFEARFPTGLPGNSPNLDVALELADGSVVGIESKFTEWLSPKKNSRPAFKEKYFADGAGCWSSVGLPKCQRLAEDLMSKRETFRLLDAPQLLKHALGLASNCAGGFALLYLYYDLDGDKGEAHRGEAGRFAERVDSELRFRAVSYQALCRRLRAEPGVDAGYLDYLSERYFDGR